jgi:lysophospholipase L1-like esterase
MMDRIVRIVILAAAVAAMGMASAGPAVAASADPPGSPAAASYYLSLGDSLAQGVQPNAAGTDVETNRGYPNQLYAALRPGDPGLQLVKLGCPGETTGTMINGGICSYPQGSQVAAAVHFLQDHPGQVSLITIDIGANDLNSCVVLTSLSALEDCVEATLPTVVANLTEIMTDLRAADGSNVRIIGMTYYVPELAEWLSGPPYGPAFAEASEELAVTFNGLLSNVYQEFGARIADVFSAFQSADFTDQVTLPDIGTVPRNVALICEWTWECAPPPRGPDEHANTIGYGIIALTFLRADLR